MRALAVLMAAAAAGASALPASPPAAQPSSAPQAPSAPQVSSAPQMPPASQQAVALLERYLAALRTLRVSFLQTLTDAQGREIGRATGTLIVERPGKFSWDTHPQRSDAGAATARTGQLMVCDGTNLWFFDRDLAQVTVKPVEAALSATPAMLLSGASDLRNSFSVAPAGSRFGLDWVLVEPRGAEADFSSALFGFDHGELKRMILEDKLGETATITFEKVERNGPVAPGEVSFIPPPGADVIGTPRVDPPRK